MASDQKTEQATPRRKQKAREKGQVVRSRELVASLATMTAALLLAAQASAFPAQWRALLGRTFDVALSQHGSAFSLWENLTLFRGVAITFGLTWMVASLVAVAQGGMVFAPGALAPNWSRLSPASRMGQLFSLAAINRLLKSLLPAAAIVYLAAVVLGREWNALPGLLHRGINGLLRFLLGSVFEVTWKSALVLVIWSGVDYLFERSKFARDLRMTRQEVLDEYKETEGNPTVKARIRRLQRQVRRRRMLKDVERAAVVITNPTEFAVALEFSPLLAAPVVVAKGRNLLAAEIKQVARWHGIPVVENPPLAHALYRAVEVGQSIPPKLYRVVAEVLAAIYRVQAQVTARAAQRNGEAESWRK
ncbi:MAG TPA: EscU/YscU/HrcU family type III secretion system export apparatus switch protein [Terriglobales bacterium]|jgi:flagellar biosynthetic protein FlhB